MTGLIDFLIGLLGRVMSFCYELTRNYGVSIILFTFTTKLILFPISLLTQKNAIRMAQLQPELDQLRMKYVDDKDKFADAQLELYKKYKYNPFLDTLPLLLQIPIVLGLVGVVYRPLSFILNLNEKDISALKTQLLDNEGVTDAGNLYQMSIIEKLQYNTINVDGVTDEIVNKITEFSMNFIGIDLGKVPSFHNLNSLILIPLLAGFSAWLLCYAQNRFNVLQIAQGRLNKIITTVVTVGISFYFALVVPGGVGLYWIAGNLFAIPLLFLTNFVIPPQKYVDYKSLQEMRNQKLLKETEHRKYSKREKADFKRFFSVKDMQLVFYSEQSGFYKYFSGIIDYICEHSDIVIHYVTSDPDDRIFKDDDDNEQIKKYYIGSDRYLIPLFMKLDADMCVMTMPDLEKYHIKRSRVRDDVEYVFACHGIGSISLYRKGALDWFDTIFCPNSDQVSEIRAYEKLYDTPEKLLVEAGYPLIDEMIENYRSKEHVANSVPQIIIAPSWQKDNIIDLCVEKLLDILSLSGYNIILRPHPQQVRHEPERFSIMKEKYSDNSTIEIQTDFSQDNPLMESDILITDWSDIAWEFSFVTKKPVVFIDTPMKIMNHEYEKIGIEPLNKTLRSSVGEVLAVDKIENITDIISGMLKTREIYSERIKKTVDEHMYNVGFSSKICGKYIIKSIEKNL